MGSRILREGYVRFRERERETCPQGQGACSLLRDLLSSAEIENIFENSDFLYLLNHAPGDREIICEKLRISPKQAEYITNAEAGEGLIIYGSMILPFIDRFPTNTRLYEIMTTRPMETTGE